MDFHHVRFTGGRGNDGIVRPTALRKRGAGADNPLDGCACADGFRRCVGGVEEGGIMEIIRSLFAIAAALAVIIVIYAATAKQVDHE